MSILKANLKHFYQRPGFWIFHIAMIIWVPLLVLLPLKRPQEGRFTAYLILSLYLGILAANMPKEVLKMPFSYCLPRHRKIPRSVVFLIGAVFNGLFSLIFLGYSGLGTISSLLAVCSGFFMGMTVYALAVWLIFAYRRGSLFIGFFPMLLVTLSWIQGHVYVERMIVHSPLPVIVVGVLVCAALWKYLASDGLPRELCGSPVLVMFDVWNQKKRQKFKEAEAARKWSEDQMPYSAGVEAFFLSRMKAYRPLSRGRYLWGMLYGTLGPCGDAPLWRKYKSGLIFLLFVPLTIAYLSCFPSGIADYPYLITIGYALIPTSLVPSSMLLPAGRSEMCYSSLITSTLWIVVVTMLTALCAVLFMALASIMPDITVRAQRVVFHTMNLKLFYVPLLVMPFGFALKILLSRYMLFLGMVAIVVLVTGKTTLAWLAEQQPITIIGLLVMMWAFLCLVTRYHYLHRCLVDQRRRG